MSSTYYKNQLSGKKRELADYNKRKSQLEGILAGYGIFDGKASELNQHCRNVLRNVQDGIKIAGAACNASGLWGKNDNGSGDNCLYNSRTYISSELRRVENKISELNGTISNLNRTIDREQRKEREEAQRLRMG